MRFVFVLEDDPKFEKEIVDTIFSIDPKIQVRLFKNLHEFKDWLREMMTNGPSTIEFAGEEPVGYNFEPLKKGEPHQLALVISKIEYLGKSQLNLLRKTRELFINRKICTREDPTGFVLTAFDDPGFPRLELQENILNNILFKPFEPLILSQHLITAIDGRHPPSKYTIANQKTSTVVEMLKSIKVEEISEVGFVTASDTPIPDGTVAKYYGPIFVTERNRSAFAVAKQCVPHPTLPDQFRVVFNYFALDPAQVGTIRRLSRTLQPRGTEKDWLTINQVQEDAISLIGIDFDEEGPHGLFQQTQARFKNIKWTTFRSFAEFMSEVEPEAALKQSSVKPFSTGSEVVLVFDIQGNIFFGVETNSKDPVIIFGQNEGLLKSKGSWLHASLPEAEKDLYRRIFLGKVNLLIDSAILPVTVEGKRFLVKAVDVQQKDKRVMLRLAELSYEEQVRWLQKNSRIPKKVHGIFSHHRNFEDDGKGKWDLIIEKLKARSEGIRPLIFNLSKRSYEDKERRELAGFIEDIFFKPIDHIYVMQKMKYHFPKLVDKADPIPIRAFAEPYIFKVATPVRISEISEAGFVMEYYRPIPLGSFREVVLWQPYEVGALELLAAVNYTEEIPGQKPTYKVQFVFFGMTDKYTKEIRIWILENYVLGKENKG